MAVAGPLLLVGGGKMGGALLGGWLEQQVLSPDRIAVIEPDPANAGALAATGVTVRASPDSLADGFAPGIVVFAVKPQVMDAVVPAYRPMAGGDTLFLSIAAGKTIDYFQSRLGAEVAIVRAMPNTPAAIGRGITVLCANRHVGDTQRTACAALLAAVGDVAWIDDEADMDAVTAVSGSGPAYVFLLIETLAEAGVAAGLDRALAERLARATVAGAGELARQSTDQAAQLRKNVTSPGGTTAAALDVLMADDGLARLMTRAVDAATRRGRELA